MDFGQDHLLELPPEGLETHFRAYKDRPVGHQIFQCLLFSKNYNSQNSRKFCSP